MKQFLFFIVLFSCLGCHKVNRPDKPDNLLSQDKMAAIFYDVYLLNSAKGINKKVIEANGILPEDYVFEKHQIDSLQFALSNDYYAYDTKVYQAIMEDVKKKIKKEKTTFEALKEAEFEVERKVKRKKDSIKRIKDSINKKKKNVGKIIPAKRTKKTPTKKTIFPSEKDKKVKN